MERKRIWPLVLLFSTGLAGCNPQWLDVKRDISLTVPSTLDDFRALLNYNLLQNDYLGLAELSADDYYLPDAGFGARSATERNAYCWEPDIYEGATSVADWDKAYEQVFLCNVVLDGLERYHFSGSEREQYDILRGEARFHRGRAFFNLAQLFAAPYADGTGQLLGIPLRLTADLNIPTTRATLDETYTQILDDLTAASFLLEKESSSGNALLPGKAAAYAALARCYLAMGHYSPAGLYADSALRLQHTLLDFNEIDAVPNYPIARLNPEVIFQSTLSPLYTVFSRSFGFSPNALLDLYDDHDRRRWVYFQQAASGTIGFRGSHTGSVQLFSGTTTAEMLLIRAECHARSGHVDDALLDLNRLRAHRYEQGSFEEIDTNDVQELISRILGERRKELVRRGLHWSDLRRLNQEPEHEQTLQRTVEGQTFTLLPNDKRYTLPIPDYIVQTTGIQQNTR